MTPTMQHSFHAMPERTQAGRRVPQYARLQNARTTVRRRSMFRATKKTRGVIGTAATPADNSLRTRAFAAAQLNCAAASPAQEALD